MKTKTILLSVLLGALAAMGGWELVRRQGAAVYSPAPVVVMNRAKAPAIPVKAAPSAPQADAADSAAAPALASSLDPALKTALDVLMSAKSTYAERQADWDELRKASKLEDLIVALKRASLDNPGDATIALSLGEAEVNQLRLMAQAHAPFNELGILAMEADQDFNTALESDPTNWEAQYEKAQSLSHWPASMNKGPEVIQQLTTLAAQQQTMTQQPEFAQTYLLLGQQYQAAGNAAQAAQAWQQGYAQFPLNSALQQKLAQASGP